MIIPVILGQGFEMVSLANQSLNEITPINCEWFSGRVHKSSVHSRMLTAPGHQEQPQIGGKNGTSFLPHFLSKFGGFFSSTLAPKWRRPLQTWNCASLRLLPGELSVLLKITRLFFSSPGFTQKRSSRENQFTTISSSKTFA